MSFAHLPDLASRALGGSVVTANDESFAERENLIRPEPATFDPSVFGHKGKVYDGWETRRRREPGHDFAVVRLGAAGVVHGVVVDTAHFLGNYPPEASVEAASVLGHPGPAELEGATWHPLVPRAPLQGGTQNAFPVADRHRWTHVRLSIYPDGGVARLRVHGEVVAAPGLLSALGTVDLAAAEHGGRVVGSSDAFYGSAASLLLPGNARSMADGWETARRRDGGNDWVAVALAAAGQVRVAELDTSYYLHNAPGWASLRGWSAPEGASDTHVEGPSDPAAWTDILPRTALQPDTRHRFVIPPGTAAPVTHVRLDAFPDGGMARLRLWGVLAPAGLERLRRRWTSTAAATAGISGARSSTAGTSRQGRGQG